ncbi:O-antigen polysaccharide polymerase Wzy [Nonlabens agnitus]|uniref:Polysaccharide polymerase n=1 Tax=Nonlabens agnitus TaxID=870484 RepID=A0A2S9WWC1_9FLAO|nr:O-antigen polysaccharide polymerase Wzy [Nonlabens agnitus]PRP67779.1 hypothetical protein BST86_12095 [Nonlabens agnitus]
MIKWRDLFFMVYLLVSLFHFWNFSPENVYIYAFFGLNFIVISTIMVYHIYIEKAYSPFLSTFLVFNYLFFLVAPMSQITEIVGTEQLTFLNKFPLQENLILKTLVLILIFNISFFVFYLKFKTLAFKRAISYKNSSKKGSGSLPVLALLWLSVGFIIILTNFDFIISEFNRPSWQSPDASVVEGLIKTKILFVIPLSGIIITTKALRSSLNISNQWLMYITLFLFFVQLFILKNPLLAKRHELGPIFFVLLFLFVPRLINTNLKVCGMIFIAMLVGFPLAQLLTHVNYGAQELFSDPSLLLVAIENGVLTNGYYSLNYDAFLNIGVIINHVADTGLSYGYQMLSGILFFIPRFIWQSKPTSSGTIVGETLKNEYGFNFTNVSNPFVSEAYHNFGYFGIIIFSIILVFVIILFVDWLRSANLFKQCTAIYFSLHLIMFLRGDFTNGMAYMGGAMISLYILPSLAHTLLKTLMFSNKNQRTADGIE